MKLLKNESGSTLMEYIGLAVLVGSVYFVVFLSLKSVVTNLFLSRQAYDTLNANNKYCEYINTNYDDGDFIQYEWTGEYDHDGLPLCKIKEG